MPRPTTKQGLIEQRSYDDLRQLIKKHSQEELFEKKSFFWTGFTSLGSYLISSTSSHYDWALKLIRRARNA